MQGIDGSRMLFDTPELWKRATDGGGLGWERCWVVSSEGSFLLALSAAPRFAPLPHPAAVGLWPVHACDAYCLGTFVRHNQLKHAALAAAPLRSCWLAGWEPALNKAAHCARPHEHADGT